MLVSVILLAVNSVRGGIFGEASLEQHEGLQTPFVPIIPAQATHLEHSHLEHPIAPVAELQNNYYQPSAELQEPAYPAQSYANLPTEQAAPVQEAHLNIAQPTLQVAPIQVAQVQAHPLPSVLPAPVLPPQVLPPPTISVHKTIYKHIHVNK